MDLVYLQRDRSFCTGKTVSSPRLQVLPFVLRPYCKAAGLPLHIKPKPGGGDKPKNLNYVTRGFGNPKHKHAVKLIIL